MIHHDKRNYLTLAGVVTCKLGSSCDLNEIQPVDRIDEVFLSKRIHL